LTQQRDLRRWQFSAQTHNKQTGYQIG